MKFSKYLKENLKLLIFYIVLMTFISLTIYSDRKNRVLSSNLFYIIFVSVLMFFIYISIDYFTKSQHIKKLLLIEASEDKTPILPPPIEYKDEVYCSIIDILYGDFMKTTKNIENNFKETEDFMTAWVHEIKTPITTSKLLINSSIDASTISILKSLEEEVEKIDAYV
jgi:hypothetical protein